MADPVSMMAAAMIFGGTQRGKKGKPPPPPKPIARERPDFTAGQTPEEQARKLAGQTGRSKLRIPKAGYGRGAGVNV